ncbi:nickel-dependent hydrogenase large subunit [Candidatus Altiarchaeota archaeon]
MKVEVPAGPVHPALLEPFRIRFLVEDEVIEDCEITFNAPHKGVERILEGVPIKNANIITERICGICSHIHLWNSCRVTERALGIEIPARAIRLRVMTAELERLHSHLLFFGHGFETLGHETFGYRSFALREPVMRILSAVSGNRVHYGVPIIGGVRPRCDPDKEEVTKIKAMVEKLGHDLAAFTERVLADPMIISRIDGTGHLSKKDAEKTCGVGPVARSSGIKHDFRAEIPEYEGLDFKMMSSRAGDNKARFFARGYEMMESIRMITHILDDLPGGPIMSPVKPSYDTEFTTSYLEAPRGELFHGLRIDAEGKARNYRIRTPTTTNLGAVEKACIGDHLTDGMMTIVSCDPCICCANRAQVVDVKTGREETIDFGR